VTSADFDEFDVIVAMDAQNLHDLRRLAPPGTEHKLRMLADVDVPDPYYGGHDAFAEVFDLVDRSCRALLDELRQA
jgi:protein-tyrosine phosphatase